MKVTWAAQSDIGRIRSRNEDYFLADETMGFYIVCDGMGGHAAGDVASRTAATAIQQFLRTNRRAIEEFAPAETMHQREQLAALVASAVQRACREVFDLSSRSSYAGMGTTATLMLIVGNKAVMAHVGDSRLYVARGQAVHQLSHDHNMVAELMQRGKPREQVLRSISAQYLTRAVGTQQSVQVDTLVFDIIPGDTFLLCSDGLSNYLLDMELASFMSGPQVTTEPLIQHANDRGGKDNITAILIRIDGGVTAEAQARANEITLRIGSLRQVFLFRELDYEALIRILDKVSVAVFTPGQAILKQGQVNEHFYIVLEGWIRVEREGDSVGTLGCGAHFGEMTLLNGKPREATLIAVERTRVLMFSKSQLLSLQHEDPLFAAKLWQAYAVRLSESLDDRYEQYIFLQ